MFSVGTGASPLFASGEQLQFWINQIGSAGANAQINGLSLVAIPEPWAYALIGGLLALGAVMVRRRM